MDEKITILLADDHAMFRSGLRALLRPQANMEVVAEAGDGRTAVRLARELSPDVVVIDVGMPDLNGIEATREITADGAGPKVIGLSAFDDRRVMMEMFKAGAKGYVLKGGAFEELALAVRTVAKNERYLSPALTGDVVEDVVRGGRHGASSPSEKLSPRERETLQLMAQGKSTKEIALCLHVSVKTIETYRRHLMEKLGLNSVAELTTFAVREGLTPL